MEVTEPTESGITDSTDHLAGQCCRAAKAKAVLKASTEHACQLTHDDAKWLKEDQSFTHFLTCI